MIKMLRGVVKAVRKSGLLSVRLAQLSGDDRKSLKTIVPVQVTHGGWWGLLSNLFQTGGANPSILL
jgi:hypothetical protein